MSPRKKGKNFWGLAGLIAVGLLFSALLFWRVPLTGEQQVDGIIGVLLSLYISSIPAANVLDMLFYSRGAQLQGLSRQAYAGWWVLNGLTLLTGWWGIFIALIRFTAKR